MSFDDLLERNADYADSFTDANFDGVARAGIGIVTCMDSRIEPLAMLGLKLGDAKILRSPGGRVTTSVLNGCVLGVQLLKVDRIMIIPHTRCAMATGTDADVRRRIMETNGVNASWMSFGASPDQMTHVHEDVEMVRSHPLIAGRAEIGGFMYDVDTGRLAQII